MDVIQMIVSVFAGAVAGYAAIRSDLADLKARTKILEVSITRAHERIDDHMLRGEK